MEYNNKHIAFLRYSFNNVVGAIRISSINNIVWDKDVLYINDIPIVTVNSSSNIHKLLIDKILIHIKLEDVDLNVNDLLLSLVEGDLVE